MANVSSNEKAVVFETILNGPGMDTKMKISFPMSRKNILLLCRIIETYVTSESMDGSESFVGKVAGEAREELKALSMTILEKTKLDHFYERLKELE